jgi:type VI protein secretion system component VasK
VNNEERSNWRPSDPRHAQRGLAGLVLAVLLLMLVWLPVMHWQRQLADEQRARDLQIKKLLAPTPASAPT